MDRKWKKCFQKHFGYGDMGWGAHATRDREKVEKEDSLVVVELVCAGIVFEGFKPNFDVV